MYCKHCGKEIDDNSKFCQYCGKSLESNTINYFESIKTFISSNKKNDYCLQHSTINYPAIRNGVQRNVYKLNGYNNTFCSVCMSDDLIIHFNNSYFPNGCNKN